MKAICHYCKGKDLAEQSNNLCAECVGWETNGIEKRNGKHLKTDIEDYINHKADIIGV